MNHLFSMDSPAGILLIEDDGGGVVSIRFDERKIISPVTAFQKEVKKQLDEYFQGKRKTFTLPVHVKGTPFQEEVWSQLKNIPYGTTVSYQELAAMTGHRRASRAVGNAVGNNPVPVLVPCHRVIRKDGSAGGYAGGVERKKALLQLEKEHA